MITETDTSEQPVLSYRRSSTLKNLIEDSDEEAVIVPSRRKKARVNEDNANDNSLLIARLEKRVQELEKFNEKESAEVSNMAAVVLSLRGARTGKTSSFFCAIFKYIFYVCVCVWLTIDVFFVPLIS